MQLPQFYKLLSKSTKATVDSEKILGHEWVDDGEGDAFLRIDTMSESLKIYQTDKITKDDTNIVISIGARDYIFVI
jgi:hypothetical protein